MKKLFFAIISILFVNAASAQYDAHALETLEAMSKKYRAFTSFEANITSSMTNEVEGIKEEFKGKITEKGDKLILVLEVQTLLIM